MTRIRLLMTIAALTACTGLAAHAFPVELAGKVVYVDDGDTLTLLDEHKQQHRIRLTDLDAPETAKKKYNKAGQPFSTASGRNLAALAKGKPATAHCYEEDNNERLVCRVVVAGVDLSLAQIRAGLAWANAANRRYVRDERAYQYEKEARRGRLGLWTEAAPVAPWVWRRSCWQQGECAGAGN